jgi:hypothetical protein
VQIFWDGGSSSGSQSLAAVTSGVLRSARPWVLSWLARGSTKAFLYTVTSDGLIEYTQALWHGKFSLLARKRDVAFVQKKLRCHTCVI